ncbi:UNVERIFIED_CONTAM: hypothetical protein GTU68_048987 [Idotea baltica]|nr:hypothetical protein [Idotea baltica]
MSNYNIRNVVMGTSLIGMVSALVGTFTVLRKRSLLGDAIAHSVLPGICLAFILFNTKNLFVLFSGAFVTGWLSILLIDYIIRKSPIKPDASIGITLSFFFGMGMLLLTAIQQSNNAGQTGLDRFLFGKAASIVGEDVFVIAILSAVILIILFFFHKGFALISFDSLFAQSIGFNIKIYEFLLSSITVLAIVIGIQAVGVVLMAALIITPAVAARMWTDELAFLLLFAALFGMMASVFGAFVSFTAPSMPTGPWIIIGLTIIGILSILFAPHKGVVYKYFQRLKHRSKIIEENILKVFYHLGEAKTDFKNERSLTEILNRRSFAIKQLEDGIMKLIRKGLLQKQTGSYALTEKGFDASERIIRLHRMWELYLTKYLKVAPDHVHETADAIEHFLEDDMEEELAKVLDGVEEDPHERKIPLKKKRKS